MNIEHATPALFLALSKAQGEIENASKKSTNPHFKSKYADLAEILNTVRDTFPKHGLSLVQSTGYDGSLVHVTTLIAHSEGGSVSSIASCVPAKSDAQGIGSSTTYLRRYSAAAMAGIAQEDDDGNAAAHNGKPAPVAIGKPMDGATDGFDESELAELRDMAASISEAMPDAEKAYARWHGSNLNEDEKKAVWSFLASNVRTSIKKTNDSKKVVAA